MKINQYYSGSDDEYIIDVNITSNEDMKEVKKLIKIYAYDLASSEDDITSCLNITKGKFTIKIEGYRTQDEDKTQIYFICNVIYDVGEDQVGITNFSYDTKAMTIKQIVKSILNQFTLAINNYNPINLSVKLTENFL